MKKKIAIIGSGSYIASHFYESIDQHDVRLFSRSFSGKKDEIVKDLFDINCDDLKGVDVVINFAAIVHQPNCNDEAIYHRVNTLLPILLAELAKEAGVTHFVQMSTVGVYGNVDSYKADSEYKGENFYAKSKIAADKSLLNLQSDEFNVSIVRPPVVYGGGASPGNIKRLIIAALRGIPFPVKGINNKRDVLHVLNLVHALNVIVTETLGGVLIPTDKARISTEDILDQVVVLVERKIHKFKLPSVLIKLIAIIKPDFIQKIYGNSIGECNMPSSYNPHFTLVDGVKDIIIAIEKS